MVYFEGFGRLNTYLTSLQKIFALYFCFGFYCSYLNVLFPQTRNLVAILLLDSHFLSGSLITPPQGDLILPLFSRNNMIASYLRSNKTGNLRKKL